MFKILELKRYKILFLLPFLMPFYINWTNANSSDKNEILLPIQNEKVVFTSDYKYLKNFEQWQIFNKNYGVWNGVINKYTGTMQRAFGKPIKINGYNYIDGSNVKQAAEKFLNDNASMLGIDVRNVKFIRASKVLNKWYVSYIQTYEGIDVLLSEIELRISENGNVFAMGIVFYDDIKVSTKPQISTTEAANYAANGLKVYENDYIIQTKHKNYILPVMKDGKISYHLVYSIDIYQPSEPARYQTFVDAGTGEILWRYNTIHQATTEINAKGSIKKRSPLDNFVTDSFEDLYIIIGKDTLITDNKGTVKANITQATDINVTLEGPWCKVIINDQGMGKNKYQGTITPGLKHQIEWEDNNSHKFERILFYHTNKVHNWIKAIDPNFIGMDYQVKVNLRFQGSSANAFWDGESITFIALSNNQFKMAEGPAVIYHEYGHGINQKLYQQLGAPYGMLNAACNEGMADLNSSLILDEAEMGIGVFASEPNRYIRTLNNKIIYPDSLKGESHYDGQILGGAFWDLRMMTSLDYAKRIAHFTKYGLPDDPNTGLAFSEWFFETLIADDDDGNLTNGTPNFTKILAAFNNHGIGTALYLSTTFDHKPINDTQNSKYPYKTDFTLFTLPFEGITLDSVYLVYSTDNLYTLNTVPAILQDDGKYIVEIPPQPAGTIVKYYFTAIDPFTNKKLTLSSQFNEFKPYSFLVGFKRQIFHDFEDESAGFTVGDVNDNATTGKWERAKPNEIDFRPYGSNIVLQTGSNHTPGGKHCYVTGAGGNVQNYIQFMPNGRTTLISNSYDLSKKNKPILRFWYWMQNLPRVVAQLIGKFEVFTSNNDGNSWILIFSQSKPYANWEKVDIPITELIKATDKMKFKFVVDVPVQGQTAYSITEVLVDDFEILSVDEVSSIAESDMTNDIRIYPNPFHNQFFIEMDVNNNLNAQVDIYNSLGLKVASKSINSGINLIDEISFLASGIYILKINSINHSLTIPIIKLK